MDDFYKTIGLQRTPQQAMGGTALASPTITPQELLFRSFASAMPPPGSLRYRTPGQAVGLGALRMLGGFAGAMSDELARQRLDPLARQYAIAQQIQKEGTFAGPPTLPKVGPDWTFGVPGEQPVGTTPLPMQVGPERFSVENLPIATRIAFAQQVAPLQQYEAAKQQIEASRAQTAVEQARLPLIRTQGQAAELQLTEAQRTERANEALRGWIKTADRASPTFGTDLATKIAELGADEGPAKGIISAMTAQNQVNYQNAQIQLGRDKLAQDRIEAAQLQSRAMESLRLGDLNATRTIVNEQVKRYEDSIKTSTNMIRALDVKEKTLQSIISDPISKKEEKASAAEDIRMLREQRDAVVGDINADKRRLSDAQSRFEELGKMSKAGARLASGIPSPPAPTPGASGNWAETLPPAEKHQGKVAYGEGADAGKRFRSVQDPKTKKWIWDQF